MKIFKNNLKKITIGKVQEKYEDVGSTKYLPSFSKEWKNTIYSYNKNVLKNIPVNNKNISKIIESYFNLFFKNSRFIGASHKFLSLKKRRMLLKKIYLSNPEIKYTNNKAIITLYTFNREKKDLKINYLIWNQRISNKLIKGYFYLYKNFITKIHNILRAKYLSSIYIRDIIRKKKYIFYKLIYLKKYLELKNLYSRKIWSIILNKYSMVYLNMLRKYSLMYSLNQSKFNKLILLPKLSNILKNILGKKIEYKIINLKSITYNTDIFTNILAGLVKMRRKSPLKNIYKILNRTSLPLVNTVTERTPIKKKNTFLNNYKDLKIISHLGSFTNLVELLKNIHSNKDIHNTIYNTIQYKNLGGIRLEVKGRLTPRYRADRSIHYMKWKGGLKNIDSSYQRLSSVLFRGNTNSNVSYSLATGKRRVGAFAVKGWIGGK